MSKMYKFVGTVAVLAFVSGAAAGIWAEVPDAGDFPIGVEQGTVGAGPLDAITGSMSNFDGIWDPADDHVDTYSIVVTDPAAFFASTDPGDGGFFIDDGGFEDDSRLWLFNLDGSLVFANDDKPAASLESYISNPATFPGLTTNSPGSVVAGQKYILAISYFDNNLSDAAGTGVASFSPFADLHGTDPLYTGPAAWDNGGDFDDAWTYKIALGGATYCVPEPGTVGLMALGALGLLYGRRRK